MAVTTYQFLNEQNTQKFAEELLKKVNVRIGERIVTTVDGSSTDKTTPSAKAVNTLITALQAQDTALSGRIDGHDTQLSQQGESIAALETSQGKQDGKITAVESGLTELRSTVEGLTHLTIQTVEGPIEEVTNPQTDVLYMQRDNAEDRTWMLYIYQAPTAEPPAPGTWINVGDTEVDLSNYWSKDDVEEMKTALNLHNAEAIPDEKITAAVNRAFLTTAPDLTDGQ